MFKIFKYKSMYEDAENERCDLELEFDKYKSDKAKEIDKTRKDYEDKIKKLNAELESKDMDYAQLICLDNEKENTIKVLTEQIQKLEKEVERKEKQRRSCAGSLGGLSKYNKKLIAERGEMMELINNLLKEIQKLTNQRRKPTLEELRNYYRKH